MLTSIVHSVHLEAMQNLARLAPPGCFVEVGVFRGGSAWRLYQVAQKQGRELHLFDTFAGTPVHEPGLDRHKVDDEFAAPEAVANIRSAMPEARLHIGAYPDTHPDDLADVAFVHCDCDQYSSYRAVIDRLWPLVVPRGVLLFDDYPYLQGAKRAVEETFDTSVLKNASGRYYVVKQP